MISLSSDQKLVLSAVQFNARTPLLRVAATTGLDRRRVRTALRDLEEERKIVPVSRVSYSGLGLVYHVVWGILLVSARKDYDRLVNMIVGHPNVAWASSCWGDYDLEVGIIAGNDHQAQDVLSSFGSLFSHTLRATERYFYSFEKSLVTMDRPRQQTFYGPRAGNCPLDEVDLSVVEAFQGRPLATYSEYSELIGIPENTVRTRAAKLQKAGVLVGEHYLLKMNDMGLGKARILVQFHAPTPRDDEQMVAFCHESPSITGLGRYAGSYDYDLTVEGELGDFRVIKDQLAIAFHSKIRSMTTIVLEETIKSSLTCLRTAMRRAREGIASPFYAHAS